MVIDSKGSPISFLSGQHLEELISIVQFGSSLYSVNPGDIDLALVVRKGRFFDFLHAEPFVLKPSLIDISLIREEELQSHGRFRFGSHGLHLLAALQEGRLLHGRNIFLDLPRPTIHEIKSSILDRLYDYLYEVRKLETLESKDQSSLQKRWSKLQRLGLLLLGPEGESEFPGILMVPDDLLKETYISLNLPYSESFSLDNFERLWQIIQEKNS